MAKIEEHTDLSPRSAGRLMIIKIPVIHPGATIGEVEDMLIKKTADLESINYVYVTDSQKKLLGVISVKEIFRSPKNTNVAEVMDKDIVTVRPHTNQSRVALLAIEHRLKEIPIVDSDNHFLGVVPYDVILNILNQEHVEETLRTAGIHKFQDAGQNIVSASAGTLVKKRLPWLLVGLGGSAVAALVIGFFENEIKSQILLAAFIPAVTYIADAVGTQSETIFVRNVALEKNFSIIRYLKREVIVGFILSSILALVIGFLSLVLWHNQAISAILALTFFISIVISMTIAIILPWLFAKWRIDPAVIGGPLDTILSDIASIVVYFSTATFLFKILM